MYSEEAANGIMAWKIFLLIALDLDVCGMYRIINYYRLYTSIHVWICPTICD